MKHFSLLFCFFIGISTTALADGIKFKQLEIDNAWIRETPPKHSMTGGYLTIKNHGDTSDVLTSVSANFAIRSEIHEIKLEGGVVKMRPLWNGLVIPAGGVVYLKPAGHHIMFMKLTQQMVPLDVHQVTLTFETSGSLTIPIMVHKMSHDMKHTH